jgi:hypothetical protein
MLLTRTVDSTSPFLYDVLMVSRRAGGSEKVQTCPDCGAEHQTYGCRYCRDCYRARERQKERERGARAKEEPPEIVLGEQYGTWLTIEEPPERNNGAAWGTRTLLWRCRCVCGREEVLSARELARPPHCPSCTKRERAERAAERTAASEVERIRLRQIKEAKRAERLKSHLEAQAEARRVRAETPKQSKHPLYSVWQGMIWRCESAPRYAGRGIRVYAAWKTDFWAFVAYIDEVLGPKPLGWSIDRINNNGDYEPGNIRWATFQDQARNTRSSVRVVLHGEERGLMEWGELLQLDAAMLSRIRHRLRAGWPPERAFMTEATPRQRREPREKQRITKEERDESIRRRLGLTPEQEKRRIVTLATVQARVRRGWPLDRAVEVPLGGIVDLKVRCGFCGELGHTALAHPEYKRVSGRDPTEP